jgi:phosphate transport system permease protein
MLAEGLLIGVALASILSVLLILVFVGREALPVLTSSEVRQEVTPAALFLPDASGHFAWQPVGGHPLYNVLPLLAGTLKVTFVALVVAVPLSVLAALYVSDFAGRKTREIIKPVVELLAGVPSVVIGFFALTVLATWVHATFGTTHRLNSIVAGIGLSFAVCPIVFTISDDALRAVPGAYREAALALGATRTETLLRVVVPAATPGIVAAIILGFGRAVGETMIVLLASGNAALFDADLGRSARTVTATIAEELGEVVVGSAHYHVLYALGVLLFLITLVVNVAGERLVHRMRGQRASGS